MPVMPQVIDAYIFYFDLIGVRRQFHADQNGTLERIRAFQAKARQAPFPFGGESTLKTLADNVWARVSASEQIADVRVMELAAWVMGAAREHGFEKFFGVITYGEHTYDLADRVLHTTGDPTEIQIQHIDMTSEPHIRAALAEKWSAHLAKAGALPVPPSCVWVSQEVFPEREAEDYVCGLRLPLRFLDARIDLGRLPGPPGETWPFPSKSNFRAMVAE